MLKLISKQNCERCTNVKAYLKDKKIDYQEIPATEKDIELYRKMLIDNDKPLGFPILLKGSEIINGSLEEITNWLQRQYPEQKDGLYFWSH